MIGNVPSNAAPCMTVDTSSAGARNTMYGTPPIAALFEAST